MEQPLPYINNPLKDAYSKFIGNLNISIVISIGVTLLYIILSIVMLAQKNKSIEIENKLNAPLNVDTVNYNAVISTRITSFNKYTLWPFLVLPLITIIIIGYILYKFLSNKSVPVSPDEFITENWFLIVIIVANIITVSIFTPLFFELRKNNKVADAKIQNFDNFVCSKLTRDSAINNLLSKKADPIDRNRLINDIVANKLPNDTEGDAKVFYTIHIYQYFHKLGTNHVHLPAALSLLKNSSRLTKCNPSKYFTRYSPNIQDLTDKLRAILRKNDNFDNSTRAALELCKKWVQQTMILANDLKSNNITTQYIRIININSIILPFILIAAYLFKLGILYIKNKFEKPKV